MSETPFNARKARTKYACPIWVDAFLRDTLDLSVDEIGAYHLILYAMWVRESCDLPDDDRKLARVSRATPQTWKRRIRLALEPFFDVKGGVWVSRRLRKEAVKTEKFLRSQSERKKKGDGKKNHPFTHHGGAQSDARETPENHDKPLKNNDTVSTADTTADIPPDHPTQESKSPSIYGGGDDAGARASPDLTEREQILTALGADPTSGMVGPNGRILCTMRDMMAVGRWKEDLGLSFPDILTVITEVMARKRDGPPANLTYFDQAMQRLAGERNRPKLIPIEGDRNDDQPTRGTRPQRPRHHAGGGSPHADFLAAFTGGVPNDD